MDGKTLKRFWAKVNKAGPVPPHAPEIGPCWQWIGGRMNSWGYGGFGVAGKPHLAHRVAWLIHHGTWPNRHVLHACDNRRCVNPAHLREGTDADNMRDRMDRGGYFMKLSESAAREILASNEPGKVLAARFGVSISTVSDIQRGKTWRRLHVTSPGRQEEQVGA
jgi:hypothetical protein